MAQDSIPAATPASDALLAAYLAARYRFELAGRWWPLAIGQPAPAALPPAGTARNWSLLTACNPQSVLQPPAVNAAADAALRAELDATGLTVLRTMASAADGGWEEPGWLVGGLGDGEADALACRYGQAGILHWREGEVVRLRMYRPGPAGDDPRSGPVEYVQRETAWLHLKR